MAASLGLENKTNNGENLKATKRIEVVQERGRDCATRIYLQTRTIFRDRFFGRKNLPGFRALDVQRGDPGCQ
jgi:hypothetical protein